LDVVQSLGVGGMNRVSLSEDFKRKE